MEPYPLFRKENVPAYVTVLIAGALIACCSAVFLTVMDDSISFLFALFWAALTVMGGMAMMFVASVLNLRKLAPGFRRLAEGQKDPRIPPVWCPVLTAATRAAAELADKGRQSPGGVAHQDVAGRA